MKRFGRTCWLLPLALTLLGAAAAGSPEDLVRQGNAAFERGDCAAAVACYNRAEQFVSDPGLVAFNKGAALYQQALAAEGDQRPALFREAELCYRCCLQDATGPRQARALYDLGNAIVQRVQDQDAKALKEAVVSYKKCLAQPDLDPGLRDDAAHNLSVAEMLLRRAEAAQHKHDSEPEEGNNQENPQDEKHGGNAGNETSDQNPGSPGLTNRITPDADGSPKPRAGATETSQPPPPGIGNLPPIPDDDKLVPLSPEDTAAYLRRAAERIAKDRREQWQRLTPPSSRTMLDW